MTKAPEHERLTLKRWSQRKHAAARESADAAPPAPDAQPAATAASEATRTLPPAEAHPDPLPPVESLTFDADFTRFMAPDVDPDTKRAALKKLFRDPRFNVMDGLDVYIDDYSKPDPIDPSIVEQLVQARYLFDPPKTRVNERGEVEDVPPEAESAVASVPAVPAIPDASASTPAASTEPPPREAAVPVARKESDTP